MDGSDQVRSIACDGDILHSAGRTICKNHCRLYRNKTWQHWIVCEVSAVARTYHSLLHSSWNDISVVKQHEKIGRIDFSSISFDLLQQTNPAGFPGQQCHLTTNRLSLELSHVFFITIH